jgi:hypothetical protein
MLSVYRPPLLRMPETGRWIMSKNTIIVLTYHRHKILYIFLTTVSYMKSVHHDFVSLQLLL